jgi:type-F conjugative transfer system protein TrbI
MKMIALLKKRWNSADMTKDFYQLLLGALGAVIVMLLFHLIEPHPKPRIGTVNVTALIDGFVKAQVRQKLSPTEQQERVQAFGQRLEKNLAKISAKYHVVLMPSEAVIAGSIDFTPQLQQRLSELN